jgi:uncharacterized protein
MEISGRTVLLTGATGGIGHAIARALHSRGGQLIVTGRRRDVLEPLATEIDGTALAADLSQRADVERLVEEAGHVDIVVHNAALPASGDILSFGPDELDRALDVNLRSPMILSRHFAETLGSRGSGHIVFISSLSGKSGQSGSAVYSATKFGLRGFAQGLRADLKPRGVGVSCIFPGFIRDAGMFHESEAKLPKGVGTSTPEEVAAGVVTAIERNKMEIDVAPVAMRVLTAFAGLAPATAAKLTPKSGEQLSKDIAAGQSRKR